MKRLVTFVILLALVGGGMAFWQMRASGNAPTFRTAAVKRGTLTTNISATGTLEPEEVVDVGSQVAGMIEKFGADPRDSSRVIDYGTPVEAGTILAQIDDSLYKAQAEQ